MPKIVFRPNPTPPPFVPPTPTPEIIYPVDIDAYSKIQFGEFIQASDTYNIIVNTERDYMSDNYEYQQIHYTNDGINFTPVNFNKTYNSLNQVYLSVPNIEVVSQAVGWYLKLEDIEFYATKYIAVTLN